MTDGFACHCGTPFLPHPMSTHESFPPEPRRSSALLLDFDERIRKAFEYDPAVIAVANHMTGGTPTMSDFLRAVELVAVADKAREGSDPPGSGSPSTATEKEAQQ